MTLSVQPWPPGLVGDFLSFFKNRIRLTSETLQGFYTRIKVDFWVNNFKFSEC